MIQVWNCGGGRQSAAIAGLIYEGRLPKPDYAVMADTEREKSSTWRYVFATIKPKLIEVGVDLVIIPKSQYATVDIFAKNGGILMPVYTENGTGKLPAYCSNEWKSRVVDRWLREQGVIAGSYITWIGYSLNELRRVRAGRYRYPLVLEIPMRASDCVGYVNSLGWPPPPLGGSACWMCPQMSDAQWHDLSENDPDDFEKACCLDEEIRIRDPNAYLHRSGKPLRDRLFQIGANDQMSLLGCDSGGCFI